ncbi:hypothetical protein BGZ81_010312 [Podila clonocystis]|nr:hypothetical protein BGZ81_010312 [Podila clonocystis]
MITATDSSITTSATFTASSPNISPTITPKVSDGNSESGSSNDVVKGAVGISVFIVTLIFTFVYCRYFRKRRTQAKIERIMQRNEPPQIVHPDSVYTNHMTPPVSTAALVQHQNNPNDSHYLYHPLPPIPAEQRMPEEHEMAHIEMQRQQLAPPPLIVYSMEGIAQPMAPPVNATAANEPPRRFTAQLTSQAAPSSTPSLASPPERAHPFARFQDPFGTQQFEEHGRGHDVSVYAQKQPQPHETYGLLQQDYNPASSSSPPLSQSAGSSSGVTGRYGYHQQPSPRPEKDHDRYSSVSSEMSAPPPPYVESMTLQLNTPSAPSPSIPLNEPPTERG